jgi:Ras-related C3 botulinum toxin substrate 1
MQSLLIYFLVLSFNHPSISAVALAYIKCDVFLVCFSVISPTSFENVRSKWHPEVSHHKPNSPIVLVGTKSDLRKDERILDQLLKKGLTPVLPQQAERMVMDVGAHGYCECSALTGKGMAEVLEMATQAVLRRDLAKRKRKRPSGRCYLQ